MPERTSGTDGLEAEYRARVMKAVEYIEARLGEPLSLEDAAAEAAWSFFHFHRVFSAVIGVPPGEYLRMRRLTEGARMLASGRTGIARIAASVGFGSVEAFHRSFKAEFGRTPSEYRRSSSSLALLNPFEPNERPLAHRAPCLAAEPSFERYGPVRLACAAGDFDLERTSLSQGIRRLWDRWLDTLLSEAGDRSARTYGIAEPCPGAEGRAIRYFAGVEMRSGEGACPDEAAPSAAGLVPYVIPEGEYLRALHRGPASRLNETYLYLYGAWLPRAGRVPGAAMDFDVYDERYDAADPESVLSEVTFRIPVAPAGSVG